MCASGTLVTCQRRAPIMTEAVTNFDDYRRRKLGPTPAVWMT
jgi:hypothetical protein